MYSAAIYRLRMIEDDKLAAWFPFYFARGKRPGKYNFWEYGKSRYALETITPDLRKAGIRREDFTCAFPIKALTFRCTSWIKKGFVSASTILRRFEHCSALCQ